MIPDSSATLEFINDFALARLLLLYEHTVCIRFPAQSGKEFIAPHINHIPNCFILQLDSIIFCLILPSQPKEFLLITQHTVQPSKFINPRPTSRFLKINFITFSPAAEKSTL